MHDAEEAVFPSAERKISHGRGDSNVNSDIPRRRFIAEAPRRRPARRKQRCLVAKRAAGHYVHGVVHVAGMNQAEHRTKDLSVRQFAARAARRNVVEHGGLHEISSFVLRDLGIASVEHDLRPIPRADTDEILHPFLALPRDHRPHLHAFVEPIAHTQVRRRFNDRVAKRFLRFAHRHRNRDGEATLSRASESAVGNNLCSHRHVGVRQDDDVILRAPLALGALAIRARASVNVPRNRRRTDKADRSHRWMIDQRIDSNLASIDQIGHAFGQSRLLQQFESEFHGERHALRGLDDQSVPAGNRVRQKPERDHARKIKCRDRRHHAQRLPNHSLVDAARHIFQVITLHHHGNAAGHLDVLDSAPHFRLGFDQRLAVLLRDDAPEIVEMLFKQHLQLEQRLDAIFGGSAPPFRISSVRRINRPSNLSRVRNRNAPQHFSRRGIDDVQPFGGV